MEEATPTAAKTGTPTSATSSGSNVGAETTEKDANSISKQKSTMIDDDSCYRRDAKNPPPKTSAASGRLDCDQCDFSTRNEKFLIGHKKIHEETRMRSKKHSRRFHKVTSTRNGTKIYQCGKCFCKMRSESTAYLHINTCLKKRSKRTHRRRGRPRRMTSEDEEDDDEDDEEDEDDPILDSEGINSTPNRPMTRQNVKKSTLNEANDAESAENHPEGNRMSNGLYRCSRCEFASLNKSLFDHHLLNFHNYGPLKALGKQPDTLRELLKRKKPSKPACSEQGKHMKSTPKDGQDDPKSTEGSERSHIGSECSNSAPKRPTTRQNGPESTLSESNGSKSAESPICPESIKMRDGLYKCSRCEFAVLNRSLFDQHLLNFHSCGPLMAMGEQPATVRELLEHKRSAKIKTEEPMNLDDVPSNVNSSISVKEELIGKIETSSCVSTDPLDLRNDGVTSYVSLTADCHFPKPDDDPLDLRNAALKRPIKSENSDCKLNSEDFKVSLKLIKRETAGQDLTSQIGSLHAEVKIKVEPPDEDDFEVSCQVGYTRANVKADPVRHDGDDNMEVPSQVGYHIVNVKEDPARLRPGDNGGVTMGVPCEVGYSSVDVKVDPNMLKPGDDIIEVPSHVGYSNVRVKSEAIIDQI